VSTIAHVFVKIAHEKEMIEPTDHKLVVDPIQGIVGDCNGHPMSPRQILFTHETELEEMSIAPGKLRENVVLNGLHIQEFKPGTLLKIGEDVEVRLTFYCEPCKRIEHLINSLSDIRRRRGVLGVILQGGEIKVGARVVAVEDQFTPLSEIPYERFLHFVDMIPQGKVVTYKDVVIGMGVASGYLRAIPNYIKKAQRANVNKSLHRLLDSKGHLTGYVEDQIIRLKREGVQVSQEMDLFGETQVHSVNLETYQWQGSKIYHAESRD